ncbi:MPT63-like [Mycobacteriaceae bacterium]
MVSASVLAAMLATPSAFADTTQATLGGQADVGGGQQWTVSALRPSADVIAYSPAGTLWEATATARPAAGGVPMVPGFAARAGAANYPVLWPVPTALGINPSALPAGGSVTGKLYFDVVGPSPVEVVFVTDGADAARWVTPPPPPGGAGAPSYSAPRAVAPAPVAAQPAPVAAAPAAPPQSGSSGTPLPASQGTPLPAEDPAAPSTAPSTAPTSASPAGPTTAAAPTTAATAAPSAPAAASSAGSQGTPLPSDSAPPATAATPSTAAAAPAPTTTAVPPG